MSTEQVYSAWTAALEQVRAVPKGDVNQGEGFKYRSIDAVMNAVHGALAAHGLAIIPEAAAQTRTNRPDAVVEKLADWFTSPTNLEAMIEETGEVPDGVAFEAAPSRVSVRVSATQAENIRILLAQGRLVGIPAGEEKR